MAYRKIFNWSRTKSCYAKILYPKTYLEISNMDSSWNTVKLFSIVCSFIGNVKFEQIVYHYTDIKVKPKRWPIL